MNPAGFAQHETDAQPILPIDAEARLEEIFPNRGGHIAFLVIGVLTTIIALVASGDWRSLIYVPLLIAVADLVATLIGRVRKRLVRGQRLVIDPDRRVVSFYNFRFRRGLLSRHEAELELPFEHLHGCRRLRARHKIWLLLITSEGDVTIGEWMSQFRDLYPTLMRIAGKAPLLSLLRDRCVQSWLLAMLFAAALLALPSLLAASGS